MMRPGTQAPNLKILTLTNGLWDLKKTNPEKFTMVVFYRGQHCPVCKTYIQSLDKFIDEFHSQGVTEIIAISGDTQEKAKLFFEECGLKNIKIGYEQELGSMADWGLYISKSIKSSEPDYFGEPGLFLIDRDQSLFYCATNSMPFARPSFEDLLKGLRFINKDKYPRRGTVKYDEAYKISKTKCEESRSLAGWCSELEMVDNHVITQPKSEKKMPVLNNKKT